MADFDEEKNKKRLEDFRKQEEEDLIASLSQSKYGIPYIDLYHHVVDNEALRSIKEETAREMKVAPFGLVGKNVLIGVRSPRPEILEKIRGMVEAGGLVPSFFMVSEASLEKVWGRYRELSMAEVSRVGGVEISAEVLRSTAKNIKKMQDVGPSIEETLKGNSIHRVSRMLEVIIAGAISIGASDVHIEPEKDRSRLRLRLDGVLQDVSFFDLNIYRLLNSRIKLLSGMKLTSKIAQDGRFSIIEDQDEINIRTSMVPGAYGESIVMRILDPRTIEVKFEELGIEPYLLSIVEEEIAKPNGLILVTGPTGSGKTTTLYAFLRKIYSPEINLITIEDPIEYHLRGITQTQVSQEGKYYTFSKGLRSALRQDPDVIMVGEIRDSDTAKIAVQSALTGHMVFSTLHTNNAAGVIPRLIDLKVNPKIVASALSLSMAQRLLRKLCPFCRVKKPTGTDLDIIKSVISEMKKEGKDISKYNIQEPDKDLELFFPAGCDKCNGTGYRGRIGIFEAIRTDEPIEKIIPESPSEREIKTVAKGQGILSMKQDGIIKVLSGITSLEELKGVVDLKEE